MTDKKPSERIEEIYNATPDTERSFDVDDDSDMEDYAHQAVDIACVTSMVIVKYLDEEAAKPKFACPHCHRIVDKLINPYAAMTRSLILLYCKHCLPIEREEALVTENNHPDYNPNAHHEYRYPVLSAEEAKKQLGEKDPPDFDEEDL
jgi:hypothetical protein